MLAKRDVDEKERAGRGRDLHRGQRKWESAKIVKGESSNGQNREAFGMVVLKLNFDQVLMRLMRWVVYQSFFSKEQGLWCDDSGWAARDLARVWKRNDYTAEIVGTVQTENGQRLCEGIVPDTGRRMRWCVTLKIGLCSDYRGKWSWTVTSEMIVETIWLKESGIAESDLLE